MTPNIRFGTGIALAHFPRGSLRAAMADNTEAQLGAIRQWARLAAAGRKTRAQQDFADAKSLSPAIDRGLCRTRI
jgi:hypothetical protein